MNKLLFVGGNFDRDGGRPSRLIEKIYFELLKYPDIQTTFYNGGNVIDLHEKILPSVIDYNIVIWFANVPNDEVKIRDVKAINPKTILITSKRNDDNKYTFAELITRALSIKANLTVEFSKGDRAFNMMVFDPLGNVFYDGVEFEKMVYALVTRMKKLVAFTRVPSVQDTVSDAPVVPVEADFFKFAHECADIFHNLIRPAKGTERFLGNMSFRCQNGFPSFRGENGIVFVSRRNVDKSDINEKSFVPTYLDENETVKYFGEAKPSVDTPVQLRLYNIFPWANYMLHAHCFTAIDCNTEGFVMYKTKHPVPCGAIEEVAEICDAIGDVEELNCSNPRLVAINLVGHGCILMANDVTAFEELSYEKDKSFVARKMPEVCEA